MHSYSPIFQSFSCRRVFALVSLTLLLALVGCGDTWRGVKKDTGENMQKAGETIEDAGEEIAD